MSASPEVYKVFKNGTGYGMGRYYSEAIDDNNRDVRLKNK